MCTTADQDVGIDVLHNEIADIIHSCLLSIGKLTSSDRGVCCWIRMVGGQQGAVFDNGIEIPVSAS